MPVSPSVLPPEPTLSSRRRRLRLGAVILAATLAGCGGSSGQPAPPAPAAPGGFAQRFTAQQVSDTFKALTGRPLVPEGAGTGSPITFLRPATGSSNADLQYADRYGTFSITVLQRPRDADVYTRDTHGKPIQPDALGLYWERDRDYWHAHKPYANLVVNWTNESQQIDASFQRLLQVVSQVGKPVAQARQSVPAGERPCAEQGVSAAGGPQATCREGEQTYTYVDHRAPLKLPYATFRVQGLTVGDVVVDPLTGVQRAHGQFVSVRVQVRNTGTKPIDSLIGTGLRVDGKVFTYDSKATISLEPRDAFPLQPDSTTTTVVAFDVPRAVGQRVARAGAFAVPGDEDREVTDADRVGAIRLDGVPVRSPRIPLPKGRRAPTL